MEQNPTIEPPAPVPQKPQSPFHVPTGVLLLIILVIGSLVYIFRAQVTLLSQIVPFIPKVTGTPSPTIPLLPTELTTPTISGAVIWLSEPKKVESVGFFSLVDSSFPYQVPYCKSDSDCSTTLYKNDSLEPKASYYLVGTMQKIYPDAKVYLGVVKGLLTTHVYKGVSTEKDFAHDKQIQMLFLRKADGSFVVTNDYDNQFSVCTKGCGADWWPEEIPGVPISFDTKITLEPVGKRGRYVDPRGESWYSYSRENFFQPFAWHQVKDFGDGYRLYVNQDIASDMRKLSTIIDATYTIRLPTGLAADQSYSPYSGAFVYKKDPSPDAYSLYDNPKQMVWTGSNPPEDLPDPVATLSGLIGYKSTMYVKDFDGCEGNMTIRSITNENEYLNVQKDLVPVATTDTSDIFYELTQTDFKVFQQFWFWKVSNTGIFPLTYEQYLKTKPILIWKNSLGVYQMVFRAELVASRCWGEPLLYLYPEKRMTVDITLDRAIHLSKTEPKYSSGWTVVADPSGTLTVNGRRYPYLFWEGSAPIPRTPAIQGVVASGGIHAYLETVLSRMGLISSERNDFEAYWEPKLSGDPYVVLSFFDAHTLDAIAPIGFSPAPETLIRILMVYQPVSDPSGIPVFGLDSYRTPSRKGFTAVEWGGVLRNPSEL